MSANLDLSIAPGFYLDAQRATWLTGPDVNYIVFNQGGVPPAISEYIAYDTLNPPNPFLAVTQDGLGRVVYDGGFPKFYNSVAPAAGTPFASLSGSFKFLYNALNWIANPEKVAAGNKKVLVLGDSTGSYSITGTDASGFKTSLDRGFAIAGFVPTYKTVANYSGGKLDARLAELDQYCAVFVMSSNSAGGDYMTDNCALDISGFRSLGNGVMLVTDHGHNVANIGAAYPAVAGDFFGTANKIARQFGAYFTGNIDRSPVNVGFLRNTYGDHPLYNGMANTENIAAGGSESRVVVAEYTKYYPGSIPAIDINKIGTNIVQAVALMNDGSIETYRGVFVINSGDVLSFVDAQDKVLSNINIGAGTRLPALKLQVKISGVGTVRGEVRIKTTKIGEFTYTDEAGLSTTWTTNPTTVRVKNGDILSAKITLPFTYTTSIPVVRAEPKFGAYSLAEANKELAVLGSLPIEAVTSVAIARTRLLPGGTSVVGGPSSAENLNRLKDFFS